MNLESLMDYADFVSRGSIDPLKRVQASYIQLLASKKIEDASDLKKESGILPYPFILHAVAKAYLLDPDAGKDLFSDYERFRSAFNFTPAFSSIELATISNVHFSEAYGKARTQPAFNEKVRAFKRLLQANPPSYFIQKEYLNCLQEKRLEDFKELRETTHLMPSPFLQKLIMAEYRGEVIDLFPYFPHHLRRLKECTGVEPRFNAWDMKRLIQTINRKGYRESIGAFFSALVVEAP